MLFNAIIPLIPIMVAAFFVIDIYRHRHPRKARKKSVIDNPDMADIHDKSLAWFKSSDNDKAALSILVEDKDGELEQMSFASGSNQLLGNALMIMMDRSEGVAELICDVVDQFRDRHQNDDKEDSTNEQEQPCDSEGLS